jgi:hypothetical protein
MYSIEFNNEILERFKIDMEKFINGKYCPYSTYEKYLSSNMSVTIVRIRSMFPEIIFGGSLNLLLNGLLNREIKDIDILLPKTTSLGDFIDNNNIDDENISSGSIEDENGNEIQRTSLKINGINICCFKVEEELLDYDVLTNPMHYIFPIKLQSLKHVIRAKILYSKKDKKHTEDLVYIFNKMLEVHNKKLLNLNIPKETEKGNIESWL